jgi:hypothetical protein
MVGSIAWWPLGVRNAEMAEEQTELDTDREETELDTENLHEGADTVDSRRESPSAVHPQS